MSGEVKHHIKGIRNTGQNDEKSKTVINQNGASENSDISKMAINKLVNNSVLTFDLSSYVYGKLLIIFLAKHFKTQHCM